MKTKALVTVMTPEMRALILYLLSRSGGCCGVLAVGAGGLGAGVVFVAGVGGGGATDGVGAILGLLLGSYGLSMGSKPEKSVAGAGVLCGLFGGF